MKVIVSQEDLDKGLSRSYTHDALCIAIRRAIQEKYKVKHSFQVLIPNRDYTFIDGGMVHLPDAARTLIKLLDAKQPTQPITFELPDLPEGFFTEDYKRNAR